MADVEVGVKENYENGVFYFSNNSKEDFVFLWNNKEYIFPAKTCSPMLISGESAENIQEIRKKAAYKWAEKEWYKGPEYKKLSKMGNGIPPIRNDKSLEPLIQMCLTALPVVPAKVKDAPKTKIRSKASKPIDETFDKKAEFKIEEE